MCFWELRNFMENYYFYGIVIAIIIIILSLTNGVAKYTLKKKFKNEYNIDKMPKGIKIRLNKGKNGYNYYKLSYPSWYYHNKDGTQDKRRKANGIAWVYSFLYLNQYKIKSKNPYRLVILVNSIRNLNKDLIIEKSLEEQQKYQQIFEIKYFESRCNAIDNIIKSFEDRPTDFENFTSRLFEKMGYKARVSSKTNDGGYDIELNRNNQSTIVECKCYSQNHSVGRPLIQKLVGANQTQKADKMIFVTTSKFSNGAMEYARETNVELIDGERLLQLINKYFDVNNGDITVDTSEWQLNKTDILKNVPKDMYRYI